MRLRRVVCVAAPLVLLAAVLALLRTTRRSPCDARCAAGVVH